MTLRAPAERSTGGAKSWMDRQLKSLLLVVDDDASVLEALRDVLEDDGYLVITARNGSEALEMLRDVARPDLAIVDLMMPVMDGWSFVAELRQDPRCRSMPVVIVTAAGDETLANAPVASGYLQKPVALETLLDVVRRKLASPSHYR